MANSEWQRDELNFLFKLFAISHKPFAKKVAIEAQKETAATLVDVIDRVLDKGLVINADVTVSIAGVELLGIKIRAALASFETAARYGLEFPSGTNIETDAWKEAQVAKEDCPQCKKRVSVEELITTGCPWCGWRSAKAEAVEAKIK